MKMNRLLPLLLAASVLATGCSSDDVSSAVSDTAKESAETVVIDTTETDDSSAPAAATATEEAETAAPTAEATEEAQAEDKPVFPAGTWMLYEVYEEELIPIGYCFTNDDGVSGNNLLFEDGEGYSFEYEIGTNEILVTVDGEETIVPIAGGDLTYVMLDIPDCGRVDMVYFSDIAQADIPEFYSNIELCGLAQQYYAALNDYTPLGVDTQTNADGTVSIHLYDNMDTHIATLARYKVDRWSTEGWDDITGEEINFLHTLLNAE